MSNFKVGDTVVIAADGYCRIMESFDNARTYYHSLLSAHPKGPWRIFGSNGPWVTDFQTGCWDIKNTPYNDLIMRDVNDKNHVITIHSGFVRLASQPVSKVEDVVEETIVIVIEKVKSEKTKNPPKNEAEVCKAKSKVNVGDIVKITDSSYSMQSRNGEPFESFYLRLDDMTYNGIERWVVLAINCHLPTDNHTSIHCNLPMQENNTLLQNMTDKSWIITIEDRFLAAEPPKKVCVNCGRENCPSLKCNR